MKEKSLADQLAEGVELKEPLAVGIQAYLDSGDESHLLSIPSSLNWRELRMVESAVLEAGKTPESAAFFTAVCGRLAVNLPEKDDSLAERLCEDLVGRRVQECSAAGDYLLALARERGLADLRLASFVFLHMHWYPGMAFGWEEEEHETIFGGATDVRLFYHRLTSVPPNALDGLILGLPDDEMLEILQSHDRAVTKHGSLAWAPGKLQGNLAKHRPELFSTYLADLPTPLPDAIRLIDWRYVITATDAFDDACLKYCQLTNGLQRLHTLIFLDSRREGRHSPLVTNVCVQEHANDEGPALAYLADVSPKDMLPILTHCTEDHPEFLMQRCYQVAAAHWDAGGRACFEALLPKLIDPKAYQPTRQIQGALFGVLTAEPVPNGAHDWVMQLLEANAKIKADSIGVLWQIVAQHQPKLFEDDFWDLLQHKSKTLRTIARNTLASIKGNDTMRKAVSLLAGKKVDVRLGGAELLERLADPQAADSLRTAIESESSEKVRTALHAALNASAGDSEIAVPQRSLEDLEAAYAKQEKRLKIPAKATWFDPNALPALQTTSGEPLSDLALTFMVAKQAKHKAMELAPDIAPLMTHIDREASGDFARTLLKQWLGSDQAAADRWALVFAGAFGDQRILPELVAPIQSWAENARHKLAEYAAQAIALVHGDEALMLLDSLANRYRSRFKNIGKACRAALENAAVARGVSIDELADMIVPTLGFDEDHERALPDSEIRVILQPDFKLTFYHPETEKETKSPPASLPDRAKDDIKTLRKLIRETVKGQTARLELALVRERRWPAKRWSELFEEHPILQSFASRLVWRSLHDRGEPRQLFRRYPNGLLANAEGELIELDEADATISMVHPLHVDADTLCSWKAHLARMKVSPPFPQLERPVALLNPKHSNRKTLDTVNGKRLSVGTFRSRAEKRGWIRGSVVDAGGISAYYKSFYEAQVDVFLPVEEMWVGQDPQDEISLGEAFFVTGGSVSTGSYEYDEPQNLEDKRVLTFGSVPAIVYSETVTDLQAIAPATTDA